jgi:ligand-binding sensor domain-containing protein
LLQLICFWVGVIESFAQTETFSIGSPGVSSNYMVETWDNTNGLPQNVIFAMEKDNHGYLWVATEEGLARLDGASLKVFDQENYPLMPEQTYYTFYKSPAGIWATSDRSIVLLEKNIRKVIDCTNITDNTWIRAVTEIDKENLLIGTDAGEIHEWKNNTFSHLDFWKPEVQLEIHSFFKINPSKLLVGTSRGLYELDLKLKKKRLISSDTFSAQKVFGSPELLFVYSSDSGIFQLNEDYGMDKIISSNEIIDINLSSLIVDSENRIWSGSLENGLIVIENGTARRFTYPELKSYSVRKIIKEDNNLFLGTLGKGLLLIKPAKVNQLNFEALRNKNVKAVYQSQDSSFWIGTKSDGLHRIKNGKIQSWTQRDGLIQNSNTTIASHEGKIYFGSNTGISVIDIQSGKVIDQITVEDGLRSNYVHAIYNDSRNWLWILTRNGGIHYLDNHGLIQQVKLSSEYDNTRFVSIVELRNKQIIIGSMNQGVFRIENGIFVQNQTLPLSPGEDVVYCIYEDKEGDLWFGTHGGLVFLKDGKFKAMKKFNGLKSNTVFSITDDGNQGIWISNNFGVQYFSYSEIQNFKDRQDEKLLISSTLFNQRIGFPNSETNGLIFPAAIQDITGKIWVPTVEGIGIIDPKSIAEDSKNPVNFIWDELRIGDQKSSIENEIEIPQGVRMFQISFNLIDFVNPSQYALFYRIAGNNASWLPIKDQRQLFFNGLKPGKYTLEVKILRFGQSDKIYSLPINVLAPFVETLSFKIILGLALILLLYFLLLLYFNKKMKNKLEEKVIHRTLELSQTNENLKNALNEIEDQNLIMKQLTWNHSHLLRAPLTRAMGISHLLINFSKFDQVEKSKEELEIELLNALRQVDEIVKDTHTKSENLKK